MSIIVREGLRGHSWYVFCVGKAGPEEPDPVVSLFWWSLRFLLREGHLNSSWWGYWEYKVHWHRQYLIDRAPESRSDRNRRDNQERKLRNKQRRRKHGRRKP